MFRPGSCLRAVISSRRPALITVVFCQSAWSMVEETTNFRMAFIWSAMPPACPAKNATNSS
jgi:hypothetical protein